MLDAAVFQSKDSMTPDFRQIQTARLEWGSAALARYSATPSLISGGYQVGNISRKSCGLLLALVFASGTGSGLPGCSEDFLGLEDYQRDLLFGFGSVAISLLNEPAPEEPADSEPPPAVVLPGPPGLSCWDLDGDGVADPQEDVNGDGTHDALDCQGRQGSPGDNGEVGSDGIAGDAGDDGDDGEQGDAGPPGTSGPPGPSGAPGPQGPPGIQGPPGPPGNDGTDGNNPSSEPVPIDFFVEEFFTAAGGGVGSVPLNFDDVNVVEIEKPGLGACDESEISVVAFRAFIPESYQNNRPVTMRLVMWRTGAISEGCFLLRLDAFRAAFGTGFERYGDTRFIQLNDPAAPNPDGTLIVVDLPINTPCADAVNGLCFNETLVSGDMLAFEFNTPFQNGACFTMLGVEFFEESGAGTGAAVHANVSNSLGDTGCTECTADDECDDATYCNGPERCSDTGKCEAGTPPCLAEEHCLEESRTCVECVDDENCGDGLFCNGVETCDEFGACQPGSLPCEDGLICEEEKQRCVECADDSECSDGLFCTGTETCDETGACQPGLPPCDEGLICVEDSVRCVECTDDSECGDALFCNGIETCDDAGTCRPGTPPCEVEEICLEQAGRCGECDDDDDCDDENFCNGSETCDESGTCQAGSAPCPEDWVCDEDDELCLECGEEPEVIDFEDLAPGARVSEVFGDGGSGPIAVYGYNPALDSNAAVVFDSAVPTGGDDDLGTPNEDFGGPGEGRGGEEGEPFENSAALGNVLIVDEDLKGAPDDAAYSNTYVEFDFSQTRNGFVTVAGLTVIDIESAQARYAKVKFYGESGDILEVLELPATGNNGVAVIELNESGVPGVQRMKVKLNGSGAVDNIRFRPCE